MCTETSPRARGRLKFGIGFVSPYRNIPACAGKALGESCLKLSEGNIPACAGKAVAQLFWRVVPWKHPRVRGEGKPPTRWKAAFLETSPRARGRPIVGSDGTQGHRNIPACAGKAAVRLRNPPSLWKHPRVRGEGNNNTEETKMSLETSPRARGRHSEEPESLDSLRNIPACAGKACMSIFTPPWCSETSPRARGRLDVLGPHDDLQRNIPACAGKAARFRGCLFLCYNILLKNKF